MTPSYSLTEQLATHLQRPVDDATRARARLHLLDWLGCVAGARQHLPLNNFRKRFDSFGEAASLLGNVLEMDDVHKGAVLHPGPVVWGLCAQSHPNNMDELLYMAVHGYEAMIAVGATLDEYHYAHWHPTAVAGGIGAAAAAARYFELDTSQTCWALANAASVAGGLWHMRHDNALTKQWHVLHACRVGFDAAGAAAYGVTGSRFILEGPQGLYAAMCRQPKPMTFPDHWRIHEVSFKPWGACRHAHPAIDAALELEAKLGHLDGDILVETYADAISFCDRPDPISVQDAKFSIQHAVAVVAQKGVPELADFEADAIAQFAEARSRVTAREASDITARYPEHYGARVTAGGQSVELTDTLGDPERPMSDEQIIGKARALIAWGGLPPTEADRAVDLALYGDDAGAIHTMLEDWLG